MIREVTRRRVEVLVAAVVGLATVVGLGWAAFRPDGGCVRDDYLGRFIGRLEGIKRMSSPLRSPDRHTHPQIQAHLAVLRGSTVELTLTNTSATPANVVRYNLPQKGDLENHVFQVGNGDDEAEYRGRLLKRGQPDEDDFDVISPGQSKSYVVDLSRWYEFRAVPGHRIWYQAYHATPFPPNARAARRELYHVVSNEVVVW